MKAEIISVGNELLNGITVNTNATYICGQLHENGIVTNWVQTVGDDEDRIGKALQTAVSRADVLLFTGGLGPTHDDITKKVVAEYFGCKLVFDEDIYTLVKERFARRGIPMPMINLTQAMVPVGARLMPNPVGTAPGLIFDRDKTLIFLLPGVPQEMQAMMRETVLPLLKKKCPTCQVKVDVFRTTGIPESAIYERIEKNLPEFSSFEIAFVPKFTGVDVRVIRQGRDIDDHAKFEKFKNVLKSKLSEYIYTTEDVELEEVVGQLLKEKGLTLAVAESLTGGLVGDRITNISGSSEYFMGDVVAYSNQAKVKLLGVKDSSLEQYGAVSSAVAREMAEGARRLFGTHLAISTTGIAGPTGATATKPVGLVYMAVASSDKTVVKKVVFGKDRLINKLRSAQAALEMVRRIVLKLPIQDEQG